MTRRALVVAVALAACVAGCAAEDPYVGSWEVNVEKSTYTPGPRPYQSQTIIVDVGGKTTIKTVVAPGRMVTATFVPVPGKEVPVTGVETMTVTQNRPDRHHLNSTWRFGGKPAGSDTVVIADDGKTLTMTTLGTDAKGNPQKWVEIAEKQ